MIDRKTLLPGPQPEPATIVPTAREARVELQGAVDQRNGGIEILAGVTEHIGGPRESARIVTSAPKRPPGKIRWSRR